MGPTEWVGNKMSFTAFELHPNSILDLQLIAIREAINILAHHYDAYFQKEFLFLDWILLERALILL